MDQSLRKWLRISFFNFLLVALIGVVMRYKIVYPLPWVDQKNLLHAHSHFAFAGWLSQALMSLLVVYLHQNGRQNAFDRYRPVLYANLVTAYGMLFTFPFMGYKFPSILFSTLNILTAYWFAIQYWKDLNRLRLKGTCASWFKAAVVFNALSSFGAFSLAYMLATRNFDQHNYLASIYFFLHFQYNGWFFFSCMGLLCWQLSRAGIHDKELKKVFLCFAVACIPAYFLSALWLPIGRLVYILVVISVLFQLGGWYSLCLIIRRHRALINKHIPSFARSIFILSAIALTIKLLLQAGSVIPSLSQLAFGFRPIIIGYLHLVLLGIITLFIIAYTTAIGIIRPIGYVKWGIMVFVAGVIANELLLMIQGVADMNYTPVAYLNQFLLIAALLLFLGIGFINWGLRQQNYDPAHK
ncbi:MAG: hypothetical protein QM781_13565 [Chitinophagaceae bacterium]